MLPNKPLDVLVQHLVTMALGGGFRSDELYREVRSAWSYRELGEDEWQWALDFVARGGQSLAVYPEYRRVLPDEEGVYRVPDATLARRHRMGIGTIVSDATMQVKYLTGATLGSGRGVVHLAAEPRATISCSAAACWNSSASTR